MTEEKPMTAPKRIQLRRTKGWRKPEGAIVVARPSKWGNPHRIIADADYPGLWSIKDADGLIFGHYGLLRDAREDAVDIFRQGIHPAAPKDSLPDYPLYAEIEAELAGHDLACWCPLDEPCHADVLLEIANGSTGGVS